jgi:hypothetical protein
MRLKEQCLPAQKLGANLSLPRWANIVQAEPLHSRPAPAMASGTLRKRMSDLAVSTQLGQQG